MAVKKTAQKRHTQAVIVIHGMGEQRPMDTIRGFVDAVLPEPLQGGEKFFSRPDVLSELFELRVLQNRSQPRTHFDEYYWAYKVSGTTFSHINSWLSTLRVAHSATGAPGTASAMGAFLAAVACGACVRWTGLL